MKCAQKSCQRSKNIGVDGFCNVCNEVVLDATKKEKQKKESNLKEVESSLKDLKNIYHKLMNGETIDQNVANGLIVDRIIKVNVNQDALEKMDARIKKLETENTTSMHRIESLETWINEQEKAIESMKKKVETKMSDLKEVRVESWENNRENGIANKKRKMKNCELCEETFNENCDYENHMEEHKVEKKFNCGECGKMFHLEWRLQKHVKIHTEDTQFCHYFNNKKICPFENIGCKFLHLKSAECKFKECKNSLCQFAHTKEADDETESDHEDSENYLTPDEDQCHICRKQFQARDDLIDHVKRDHVVYYQGMLEAAANLSSSDCIRG